MHLAFDPEIIGYLAAFFTTIAYIPQMIKVFRHKHTKSISTGMYVLISTGIGLWCIYGIMIDSPSLVLANGITFVLAVAILVMKLKHG